MDLTVEPRPHAPLSPSAIGRFLACGMSWQLTRELARQGARPVAARDSAIEGTAVHAVLEAVLKGHVTLVSVERVHVEGTPVTVTERMREAVRVALDWIAANLAGRELRIEPRLTLPWGGIYGYADLCTAGPPWTLVDFKYGFYPVPAHSPQLAAYLLALIGNIEGAGEATAAVIQPRTQAAPVRTHVWTYHALRAFRDRLIDALDRRRRGEFAYAHGDHCRFCPALSSCPHIAAVARDAAAVRFAAPELISQGEFGAERLDAAMRLVPIVDAWARQTAAIAEEYMMSGGRLAGFKLVRKGRDGKTLTVTHRDDPREEVNVAETLKTALRSSVAFEYLKAANQ
jgi:hypothetical protein